MYPSNTPNVQQGKPIENTLPAHSIFPSVFGVFETLP